MSASDREKPRAGRREASRGATGGQARSEWDPNPIAFTALGGALAGLELAGEHLAVLAASVDDIPPDVVSAADLAEQALDLLASALGGLRNAAR